MRIPLVALFFASLLVGLVRGQVQLIPYGQDLALRDRWIAQRVVHADLGGYLVTRIAADALPALQGRYHALPALAAGESLAAVFDRGPRVPVPAVRVLFDLGGMRLVAGSPSAIAGLRRPGIFHGGVQQIDLVQSYAPVSEAAQRSLPLATDPRISAMVAKVATNALTGHIRALSTIHTRNARSTYNAAAVQYLQAELAKIPQLSVKTESFSSTYGPNVIAELPGYELKDEIVFVGAHFDSYAGSSSNPSPGADDNASGTAAVLEIARICAATPLRRTVRFGFWNAEEFGLIGSNAYAQAAKQRGDKIIAYLNTDMNAYRAPGDTVDVDFVLNDSTASLIQTLSATSQAYVPALGVKQGYLSGGTSDHRSFFRQGYPAVFYFEDLDRYSPFIHRATDDMVNSTNDMNLSTLITQSVCAGLASLAEPLDVPQFTLSVATGPSVGGTRVQVTGTSLVQIQSVKVGGRDAPFETIGGLSFVTPTSAQLGTATVVITNPAGQGKASFSYLATQPPALLVQSPVAPGASSDIAIGGPSQGYAVSFVSAVSGTTSLGLVQLDIGAGSLPALVLFDIGVLSQGGGTLERRVPIPPVPALRGQKFYLQAATLDASFSTFDKTNVRTLSIQ